MVLAIGAETSVATTKATCALAFRADATIKARTVRARAVIALKAGAIGTGSITAFKTVTRLAVALAKAAAALAVFTHGAMVAPLIGAAEAGGTHWRTIITHRAVVAVITVFAMLTMVAAFATAVT